MAAEVMGEETVVEEEDVDCVLNDSVNHGLYCTTARRSKR